VCPGPRRPPGSGRSRGDWMAFKELEMTCEASPSCPRLRAARGLTRSWATSISLPCTLLALILFGVATPRAPARAAEPVDADEEHEPATSGAAQSTRTEAPAGGTPDVIDLSLEELMEVRVVVSVASAFAESALLVGSTVAQVSREDWWRRGARTLADAIGSQPGILVSPGTIGSTALSIRGFTNAFSTRGINVQLDGVPLNTLKFSSALADLHSIQLATLDRVELVRGPGSSLYGADAFHGVVSLKTFAATQNVLEGESEIGSDRYRRGALRLSRAVAEGLRFNGAWSFNANSDQDARYTYTEPPTSPTPGRRSTGERANRFESWMGVFKLQSDPGKPASVSAGLYLKGQDQRDFPGPGRVGSGAFSSERDRDLSEGESAFALGTLGAVLVLPRQLSLELTGSYWDLDSERSIDRIRLTTPQFQILDEREHRADVSVLLKQPGNMWNTQWAVGYERSHLRIARSETLLLEPSGAVLAGSGPDGADGARRDIHGLVLQAKTSLLEDRLHLLYGVRYDHYLDDFARTSGTVSHVSPRMGVIYQPSTDSAIKLLYGNAQRLASAVEVGGAPTILAAPLDPELIDTYELVFLKQARSLRAQLSVFRSDWRDAILLAANPTAPPPLRRVNVGENAAHGVEASLTWVQDRFRVDLSSSYVRSEDSTNDVDYVAFPKIILNAGLGYRLPWHDLDLYVHNRMHFGADEGPITSSIPDPDELKDYWRTDLSLTWHLRARKIDIFVQLLNVFDRENFLPAVFNAEDGIPDVPFTASIGFRWTY
jgi:outer membrane receptor protein involved in Fe transport